MSSGRFLSVTGLRVDYLGTEVLHGLDLEVDAGERLLVLGPNGAGKSTLLRCLGGPVKARTGSVLLDDVEMLKKATRERIRLGLSLCPEGRHLFPRMTLRENLLLGAAQRRQQESVLHDLEAIEHHIPWISNRWKHLAGTLSGGEQQMIAVARALMARPRLLLLDEPTMGLSPTAVERIRDWLLQLSQQQGLTILSAEQNVAFARQLATRVIVLSRGRITAHGFPEELVPQELSAPALAARFF